MSPEELHIVHQNLFILEHRKTLVSFLSIYDYPPFGAFYLIK